MAAWYTYRETFEASFAVTFFFPAVLKVLDQWENPPKHGFMLQRETLLDSI